MLLLDDLRRGRKDAERILALGGVRRLAGLEEAAQQLGP